MRRYHAAELVDEVPAPAPIRTLGGFVDEMMTVIGLRLPSPLPVADALFGAPSWLVPGVLAAVAAGAVGIYAVKRGPRARGGRARR